MMGLTRRYRYITTVPIHCREYAQLQLQVITLSEELILFFYIVFLYLRSSAETDEQAEPGQAHTRRVQKVGGIRKQFPSFPYSVVGTDLHGSTWIRIKLAVLDPNPYWECGFESGSRCM
jgi:hypothetical protein